MKHDFPGFRVFLVVLAAVFPLTVAQEQETGGKEEKNDQESADFKNLKNPVPYTERSIARGKAIYLRNCTECHDADGRALAQIVANATDLTAPQRFKHGTTDGEIFRSIRDGAGLEMPPFKASVREDDIWHMVNFIRGIGPESLRPPLQREKHEEEQPSGSEQTPERREGP